MISKSKLKQKILFWSIISIAILNHVIKEPKIATFLGIAVFIIFSLFETKNKLFFKILTPFIIVILTGFVFSFKNNTDDVVRDGFYFLNPLLYFMLGSIYALNFSLNFFLRIIIIIGTVLSLIFIIQTFFNFGLNIVENQNDIRGIIGVGNPISILTLTILLFYNKYPFLKLIIRLRYRILLLVINFTSLIFFASRTYLGIFLIIVLFLMFPFIKKQTIKYFSILIVAIIGLILVLNSYKDSFLVNKLYNSLYEISITEAANTENVNINYRGYETLMAIDTYLEGSITENIFGLGFGKLIDLKMFVGVGGDTGGGTRFIPILHNGFAYLLVKTGIIGMLFFLIFIYRIFAISITIYKKFEFLSLFTMSSIITLLFATFIVSGFFNMEFIVLMLIIGALLQYTVLLKLKKMIN